MPQAGHGFSGGEIALIIYLAETGTATRMKYFLFWIPLLSGMISRKLRNLLTYYVVFIRTPAALLRFWFPTAAVMLSVAANVYLSFWGAVFLYVSYHIWFSPNPSRESAKLSNARDPVYIAWRFVWMFWMYMDALFVSYFHFVLIWAGYYFAAYLCLAWSQIQQTQFFLTDTCSCCGYFHFKVKVTVKETRSKVTSS